MHLTLITGASSGIGEEFARQCAEKGHSLILVARSEDKLKILAQELSQKHQIKTFVISQDLAELQGAEELHGKVQALGLEVNFLINNAGFGLVGPFEAHDLKKIEQMLLLNIVSVTKLSHLFLPQLIRNQGMLLNVASQGAFEPIPYMGVYGATKAYILNFTEALHVELKNSNVKVMALCPGPTYTNFFEAANISPEQINFKIRNPAEVVKEALKGIEGNKEITIPGWENQLLTFMTRLLPRSLLARISQYNIKQSEKKL